MSLITGLVFNPLVLLSLLGLALWQIRRTHQNPALLAGRGLLWRRLALVFLGLHVAGLGLCGGWGTLAGLSMVGAGRGEGAYGGLFLVAGGAGLLLAAVLGWQMWRYGGTQASPGDAPTDAPSP